MIVCDLVTEELPHASIALQVLAVVIVQPDPPITSAPTCTIVNVPQTSDAVGAVKDGVPVHSIVASEPAAPINGAVLSVCVIVCDLVTEELPQASIALQVLVVVMMQPEPPVTSAPTWTTV